MMDPSRNCLACKCVPQKFCNIQHAPNVLTSLRSVLSLSDDFRFSSHVLCSSCYSQLEAILSFEKMKAQFIENFYSSQQHQEVEMVVKENHLPTPKTTSDDAQFCSTPCQTALGGSRRELFMQSPTNLVAFSPDPFVQEFLQNIKQGLGALNELLAKPESNTCQEIVENQRTPPDSSGMSEKTTTECQNGDFTLIKDKTRRDSDDASFIKPAVPKTVDRTLNRTQERVDESYCSDLMADFTLGEEDVSKQNESCLQQSRNVNRSEVETETDLMPKQPKNRLGEVSALDIVDELPVKVPERDVAPSNNEGEFTVGTGSKKKHFLEGEKRRCKKKRLQEVRKSENRKINDRQTRGGSKNRKRKFRLMRMKLKLARKILKKYLILFRRKKLAFAVKRRKNKTKSKSEADVAISPEKSVAIVDVPTLSEKADNHLTSDSTSNSSYKGRRDHRKYIDIVTLSNSCLTEIWPESPAITSPPKPRVRSHKKSKRRTSRDVRTDETTADRIYTSLEFISNMAKAINDDSIQVTRKEVAEHSEKVGSIDVEESKVHDKPSESSLDCVKEERATDSCGREIDLIKESENDVTDEIHLPAPTESAAKPEMNMQELLTDSFEEEAALPAAKPEPTESVKPETSFSQFFGETTMNLLLNGVPTPAVDDDASIPIAAFGSHTMDAILNLAECPPSVKFPNGVPDSEIRTLEVHASPAYSCAQNNDIVTDVSDQKPSSDVDTSAVVKESKASEGNGTPLSSEKIEVTEVLELKPSSDVDTSAVVEDVNITDGNGASTSGTSPSSEKIKVTISSCFGSLSAPWKSKREGQDVTTYTFRRPFTNGKSKGDSPVGQVKHMNLLGLISTARIAKMEATTDAGSVDPVKSPLEQVRSRKKKKTTVPMLSGSACDIVYNLENQVGSQVTPPPVKNVVYQPAVVKTPVAAEQKPNICTSKFKAPRIPSRTVPPVITSPIIFMPAAMMNPPLTSTPIANSSGWTFKFPAAPPTIGAPLQRQIPAVSHSVAPLLTENGHLPSTKVNGTSQLPTVRPTIFATLKRPAVSKLTAPKVLTENVQKPPERGVLQQPKQVSNLKTFAKTNVALQVLSENCQKTSAKMNCPSTNAQRNVLLQPKQVLNQKSPAKNNETFTRVQRGVLRPPTSTNDASNYVQRGVLQPPKQISKLPTSQLTSNASRLPIGQYKRRSGELTKTVSEEHLEPNDKKIRVDPLDRKPARVAKENLPAANKKKLTVPVSKSTLSEGYALLKQLEKMGKF